MGERPGRHRHPDVSWVFRSPSRGLQIPAALLSTGGAYWRHGLPGHHGPLRQKPVTIQLPSMAGDAQGEGLAGSGPPHDHGDAGAALAQIADHRLLIRPTARMSNQGVTHGLMGGDGRLLLVGR
jgi:hypothetical protein